MISKNLQQNIEWDKPKEKEVILDFIQNIYEIESQYQELFDAYNSYQMECETKISKEETIFLAREFLATLFPLYLPKLEQSLRFNKIKFYHPNTTEVPDCFEGKNVSACVYENDTFTVYLPLTNTIFDGSNLIHEWMHLTNAEGESEEFYYLHETIPFFIEKRYQEFIIKKGIGTNKEQFLLKLEEEDNCYELCNLLINRKVGYCDKEVTTRVISHFLALLLREFLFEREERESLEEKIILWNETLSYLHVREFMEQMGLEMEVRNDTLIFTEESMRKLLSSYQRSLEKKQQEWISKIKKYDIIKKK